MISSPSAALLLGLALASGAANAALPADSFGFSAVYSNFSYKLTDTNLTDNLVPQSTVSEDEFRSFFSGTLAGYDSIGENRSLTGYLGPNTSVEIGYTVTLTLYAPNLPDSYAFLLYEDVYMVESGDSNYQNGIISGWSGLVSFYSGILQTSVTYDSTFEMNHGQGGEMPSFAKFSVGLGDSLFEGYAGQAQPIPEPTTYALMFAGLAAVGLVARRSRRRADAQPQIDNLACF